MFSDCPKIFFEKKVTFLLIALVVLIGSVFIVDQRLILKKSAQGDGSTTSLVGCRLIPSSLYGAPEEEWKKYECVDGVAKLKTALLSEKKDDSLVENLQVPSIKSFASSVQTGDATVNYPIEIPPAAGGFAPSISLNYSSSAVADMRFNSTDDQWKNGWSWSQGSYAGLGWNLSGISQIFQNSAGRYYLIADGKSFELEGPDGQNNPNSIDKISDDFVYTTKPNSHIKVIREYRSVNDFYQISTGGVYYKDAAVDYRSWDVWMKDGKHYHFEPLGFMPIKYLCNKYSDKEKTWNPTDSDGKCRYEGDEWNGDSQVKRLFNKWVLTQVQDTSNNKINYEYNFLLDWEKNYGNDPNNLPPDGCRQQCLNDQPVNDEKWDDCTTQCFTANKTIDNNQLEVAAARGDYAWTFPKYGETDNKRRVLYPRAIYPVSIKYGVGLRTGKDDNTNKINFIYSKRNDNNYGWNKRQTGDRKLDEIRVYLGNNLVRSYQLTYSYSEAGPAYDSYTSSANKIGQLLLTNIKLRGAGETPADFPIFQSYEYYPKGYVCDPNICGSAESLLLKKANNGYGASVEYNYEKKKIGVYWEWENPQSPEIKADGVSDYREPSRLTRPRLISKTTRSSSNSQAQRTTYLYPNDREDGITCTDNTQTVDCHTNGHATLHLTGDFEFLGWSRVQEILSSSENGTNFTDKIATYYNFNPGGYDLEKNAHFKFYTRTIDSTDVPNFPGSENPYFKKGTLARKTTVKFNGTTEVPVSADNMAYITTNVADAAYNNLFFNSETKSCADLDIGDEKQNLRRAGYSKIDLTGTDKNSIDDYFDSYGNQIKQVNYVAGSCRADFAGGNYYPIVSVGNPVVVSTTLSNYWANLGDYIVDKPESVELKEKENGASKSLSFSKYNNKGLPEETLAVDNTMISEGLAKTGILSKATYDNYGNPEKKISYKDYVTFDLAKSNGVWAYPAVTAPSTAVISKTAYDEQFFQAFPKTVTGPGFSNDPPGTSSNITTIMYDFETGTAPILGLPVKSKDPNQLETKTAYDSFGRIIKKVNPGDTDTSPTAKYYYTDRVGSPNNPAMIVEVAKKNDAIADDTRDSVGRLLSYAFYNDLGQKLQTQSQAADANNLYIDYVEYDALGRVTNSIASREIPEDETVGCGSTPRVLGRYTSNCAPRDFATRNTYDTQGRAIRVVNPDNTCSVTKYEGKKTYAIDPNKNLSSIEGDKYETRGGELRSIKTAIAYDAGSVLGALTSNSNIFLKLIKYFSTSTRAVKLLTATNLCEGETFNYPILNIANIYTQQETETNVLGQTVVASVKDSPASGKVLSQTTSAYDGLGRVTETFDPDLGTNKILAYNALGQALQVQDNKGTTISTVYDDLGRVTQTSESTPLPNGKTLDKLNSILLYDLPSYGMTLGKLVKEQTPGEVSKEYFYQGGLGEGQSIGLLSKTKQSGNPGLTEELTYDAAGRVKTISYTPGKGTVNEWQIKETLINQYDQIGRLISIASNLRPDWTEGNYPIITDISYNPFGLPVEKKYSNDVIESFVYDEANKTLRLKEHTVSRNGNSYLSLNYLNYDDVGNIKELKDNKLNETTSIKYDYDSFYRLTGVSGPYTASYDYDKLGRMIKKNEKENLTYHFDDFTGTGTAKLQDYYPLNAPKRINDTTKLEYKDGNLTQTLAGLNLTYDGLNRLIKTENADSVTKYTYDFSGQRSSKTESSANGQTATYYSGSTEFIKKLVLNSGAALPMTDVTETIGVTPATTGTITETYKRYYPFGGLRTIKRTRGAGAQSDEKNFYYIFTDHLSSTKAIIDQNGAVSSDKFDYYPYGNMRVGESAPSR